MFADFRRRQLGELPTSLSVEATDAYPSSKESATTDVAELFSDEEVEALLAHLGELAIYVNDNVTAETSSWGITKAQLKRSGLDSLYEALVNGYRSNADDFISSGVDKKSAQAYIGILWKMN